MKMTNAQRKINIIKNVAYLMRSRGETKASFSERSGITRTTIYKILEGKVNKVQETTLHKIASFFGVPCDEMECYDLEQIQRQSETLSIDGNKNPSAVPIIPEKDFIKNLNKTVGQLVTEYPLTYIFDDTSNVIALKIESPFFDIFSQGDILIIKRSALSDSQSLHLYVTPQNQLIVKNREALIEKKLKSENLKLIGFILEERCENEF
ncbi:MULTISPECIES: helix-turn-helix domain-containing protein [Candidatus Hamiltonella]|uniref:Transcriptional regulator n=1 Tax=Candidatus Williamhamiltonella defendens TaxID=138072 RepID=A0A2D3TCY2_9ENTR|nr:helix-turn-helix transcriptional regulator [Candidatus Hamiltonella defensa]ATW33635.1 transcriptional regulator [Candidatus Hamiltonella defensa]